VQEQCREHGPNVSAQRTGSPSVLAAEETKAVHACVRYLCQRKSKSPSEWGTVCWLKRWDLLQAGPCVRSHTAWLVIPLFLQRFAQSSVQHQCRTGEDEVAVVDVERAGTSTLTCTGLAKRHWREALALHMLCWHSHSPPQPGSAWPKQGSKLWGGSTEGRGDLGVHTRRAQELLRLVDLE